MLHIGNAVKEQSLTLHFILFTGLASVGLCLFTQHISTGEKEYYYNCSWTYNLHAILFAGFANSSLQLDCVYFAGT